MSDRADTVRDHPPDVTPLDATSPYSSRMNDRPDPISVEGAPTGLVPGRAIIERAQCPDCASHMLFSYDGLDPYDGLHSWSVTVAHQTTCPAMRGLTGADR